MAILLLALLAPTVDAYVCIDDPASVTFSGQKAVTASTETDPAQHAGFGDDCLCLNCNCQHLVGVYKPIQQMSFGQTAPDKVAMSLASEPPPAPFAKLLRPPRA